MMKVAHLTSVHASHDVRIFRKEAVSLAASGFNVTVIAKGTFSGMMDGVCVRGMGEPPTRFHRIVGMTVRVLAEALRQEAQVYHLHDPELIPAGLLLKLKGAKVVYDAHEEFSRQILSKHWIPRFLRRIVGLAGLLLEWLAGLSFNGIVAAYPAAARRYPVHKTWVVNNYPILNEVPQSAGKPYLDRSNVVVYAGGITAIRGAKEMVQAIGMLPESLGATLALAGSFDPESLAEELRLVPGWSQVRYLGWVGRGELWSLLGGSRVGIVTLHPEPNYVEAEPVKLFEYMLAGLPVVASDFPVWREIVETCRCGLLVAPLDPHAIADAIEWLLRHDSEADLMGRNGRRLVRERFNWSGEARKLIELYKCLQQ